MKIGFIGTGGTGKTTTIDLLRPMLEEAGIQVPYLGSVTRQVWEKWGAVESDQDRWTPEQKLEFQMEVFRTRMAAEEEMDHHFISDRTLIDHSAYAIFRCYDAMTDAQFDKMLDDLVDNVQGYDRLFYFPITFVPEADGLRQTGEAVRTAIDYIMRGLIDDNDIEVHTVGTGTPEARAAEVFHKIHDQRHRSLSGADDWKRSA